MQIRRMIIPLGVQSPERSSSLPAARHPKMPFRDGPSLTAYLALLRLGFTVPPLLPVARWALTPPFHPYRIDGLMWRSLFCGTVRHAPLTQSAPRRYLAICPMEPGLSSKSIASTWRCEPCCTRPLVAITRPTTSRACKYSETRSHGMTWRDGVTRHGIAQEGRAT